MQFHQLLIQYRIIQIYRLDKVERLQQRFYLAIIMIFFCGRGELSCFSPKKYNDIFQSYHAYTFLLVFILLIRSKFVFLLSRSNTKFVLLSTSFFSKYRVLPSVQDLPIWKVSSKETMLLKPTFTLIIVQNSQSCLTHLHRCLALVLDFFYLFI